MVVRAIPKAIGISSNGVDSSNGAAANSNGADSSGIPAGETNSNGADSSGTQAGTTNSSGTTSNGAVSNRTGKEVIRVVAKAARRKRRPCLWMM